MSLKKGLGGRILEENKKALYIHCNSHIRNLSLDASIKMQEIDNVLSLMHSINIFFLYSPKREGLLKHVFKKIVISVEDDKFFLACARQDAYEHFYLAFAYIVESLKVINGTHPNQQDLEQIYATGWDTQSRKDATSYLKDICDFPFIISLVSLYTLFHPVHAKTVRLQGSALNIVKAHEEIPEVTNDLTFV